MKQYRLGVDVGGTHTDLVLLDILSGALLVEKVSSTPANPALGVLNGIRKFVERGINPQAITFFSHGTTVTTNALLEMRGSRVGMLVTQGFRAIQEVQNQARDGNLFDYFYVKPTPIAPQSCTIEIPERSDYLGNVLLPLDLASVRAAARRLRDQGVESIAVCYLFSFMNPHHEEETRRIILEEAPGITVSLSSEVLPRLREWSRMSATLVNAYLEPVLVRYLAHLNTGLNASGVSTQQRFLMQSNGGVMPFSAAIHGGKTVHTLLSGPAAGAQASAYLTVSDAERGLVTLDMGGTSADIAFIKGGVPMEVTEGAIARRQIDVPTLDMTTISAGGGSIAWIDSAGFLTVGPHSAGASPGPACYDRGGQLPTVTDADVVCGYLNPDYFLGGAQKLDAEAAWTALRKQIAQKLHMDVREAAAGIRRIVDMRMADEIRVFAAKRGIDLSAFTLLPFGGAGAVHAAAVAEELNMRRILVPPRPGAFSALGLLCTDVVHDYIRSELMPLDRVIPAHAQAVFAALEAKARAELADEGMDLAAVRFSGELDMRYMGQGYELRTPLAVAADGHLDAAALAATRRRFDDNHQQIHGHAARERQVEVVSYRLRARVAVPKYQQQATAAPATLRPASHAIKGARDIWFDWRQAEPAVIYERDRLDFGITVAGPAVVEQFDATTVIPRGWRASVDQHRNLVLEKEAP
jgi:N-methylhydantoinase A